MREQYQQMSFEIKQLIQSIYNEGDATKIISISGLVCSHFFSLIQFQLPIQKVANSKTDRRKFKIGNCFGNASVQLDYNHCYMEGVVTNKITGFQLYHAWNIDTATGVQIDYTFGNSSEEYNYQGLLIPSKIVRNIGLRKGGLWGPILPYVTMGEFKLIHQQYKLKTTPKWNS